jgi:CRISPR-associated protein Csd1
MILQALCGYYERLAAKSDSGIAMPGWAVTNVTTCITINENGEVVNVLSLIEDKKPKPMIVPQQPKRSSGVCPAFLCDNAGYFLGMDEKKGTQKIEATRKLHQEILGKIDDKGAHAVIKFFTTPEHKNLDEIDSGNIVFRLSGESNYIHNRPAIRDAWEKRNSDLDENADTAQCLVTGDMAPVERLHGNLSGFGQDKPTLVGFNQESFKSYNLTKGTEKEPNNGTNAPVSKAAAFRYVTALNALITDPAHIVRMADTKLVFWAEHDAAVEENFLYMALGGKQDEKQDENVIVDEGSARKIKALLSSVKNGKRPDEHGIESGVTFHILGISAAKTRLVVRFFYSDTFGNLLDRIGQHYRDIEIVGTDWEVGKLVKPSGILLETAVQHEYKNIPPTLEGALMRSIITGCPYPYSLYNAIITRVRADKIINSVRIGVIKGVLNRNARIVNRKELMTVTLNSEEKNTGYLLGRLFAVLVKEQYDALGKVNATIVDKYLNSALATPQTVFPVLLPLFEKHVSKSEKYFSKQLVQKIVGELLPSGFPQTLNAEDQGRFLIGYYHQRQDFYKGNSQSVEDNKGNGGNENE